MSSRTGPSRLSNRSRKTGCWEDEEVWGRVSSSGWMGVRSGWFSVGFDSEGRYELKVFPALAFSELLNYHSDAKLMLVDIPIGLPEGPGGRECDKQGS